MYASCIHRIYGWMPHGHKAWTLHMASLSYIVHRPCGPIRTKKHARHAWHAHNKGIEHRGLAHGRGGLALSSLRPKSSPWGPQEEAHAIKLSLSLSFPPAWATRQGLFLILLSWQGPLSPKHGQAHLEHLKPCLQVYKFPKTPSGRLLAQAGNQMMIKWSISRDKLLHKVPTLLHILDLPLHG